MVHFKMSAETGNRGNGALRFAACQDGAFSLDKDVLQKILLNHELGNIKVYAISVVGPLRTGKSFLMSLFVRYLQRRATGQNAFEDRTEALSGFEWKDGSVGVTKGMWMWPEVFLLDTGSGEKVGIVLVDTQGVFDEKSSKTEDALLFSVTALASSVLIYNVQSGINQKALEHFLELLISMSEEFMPSDKTKLEKCLFLVRDWLFLDEHESGIDGGKAFLQEKFNDFNESNDNASYVRKFIKGMFKDVACFLMSHPGMKASRNQFDGKLADLEDYFVDDIQSLATYLFGLEDTNSAKLTCQELFQLYTSFSGKRITNFKDFITFDLETKLEKISTNARYLYISGFTPSVAMSTIVKEHKDNWDKALLYFDEQTRNLKAEETKSTELFKENLCKGLVDSFFEKLLILAEMEYKKMFDGREHGLRVLVEKHLKAKEDIDSSMKMASAVGQPEQYDKACSELVVNLKPILGEKLMHEIVRVYETELGSVLSSFGPSVTIENISNAHRNTIEMKGEILSQLPLNWIDEEMSSKWTKKINIIYCKSAQCAGVHEYRSIMTEKAYMNNFSDVHYKTQNEVKMKFLEEISSKSEDATDDYRKELEEKIKEKEKEVAVEIVSAYYKKKLQHDISKFSLVIGGKEKAKFDDIKVQIRHAFRKLLLDIPESEMETCYDKAVQDVQDTYDTLLQFGEEVYKGALAVGSLVTGFAGAATARALNAGAGTARTVAEAGPVAELTKGVLNFVLPNK